MRLIRTIITLALLIVLQISLVDLIAIRGFKPDLLLLYILFRLPGKGVIFPVLAGFGIGLLQDLVGGGFLGVYAFSKSVVGFFLSKFFPEKAPAEKLLHFIAIAFCVLVHDTISQYIYLQDGYSGFFKLFFYQILPSAGYNFFTFLLLMLLPFKRKSMIKDGMAL